MNLPESTPFEEASTDLTPELVFEKLVSLGIGKIYGRPIKRLHSPPAKEDTLARIEAISGNQATRKTQFAQPELIVLPLTTDQTSHFLIFRNGLCVIVSPPNHESSSDRYKKTFDINLPLDNDGFIVRDMITAIENNDDPVATLRNNSAFFMLTDPRDNEQSLQIVKESLPKAYDTARSLYQERLRRETDIIKLFVNNFGGIK